MPAEVLREPGQDRSGRADGQLLAGDLEQERPEGIKPRQFVDPRAWPEVGMRVDDAGEDRIGVAKELPRSGIGDGGGRHAFNNRPVRTISITSSTVSWRAESRWSSTARATQVTGRAPARTTRSTPVRYASSLVPPIASTTG